MSRSAQGSTKRLPAALLTYATVVALLGYDAFSADTRFWPQSEVVAFVLLLPAGVLEMPAFYLVGALAWQVRDGLEGRPMWPVTATFTVLFFGAALLNGLLLHHLLTRRRRVTAR